MNTDTKVCLKKKFKEYYWRKTVDPPSEIHKREFGVGTLDDKIKVRHKSFKTGKKLTQYLKTEAPYYISYSIAYYEFPENQPMGSKNWLGADLVFDLDRDIQWLNQGDMDAVLTEALTLIEFLTRDLGINRRDIKVNFSGSKGYHIHVFSQELRALGGEERREIIDYVTGTGLDMNYFIHEVESPVGITYSRGKPKLSGGMWIGPKSGDKGWPGRIHAEARRFLESKHRRKNLDFLDEGKWDAVFDVRSKLRKKVVEEHAVKCIEDADRMVTFDTARLIRLPDTLHGSSGLKAASVKNMDSFNPLVDAVVFGDAEVGVSITGDVPAFELLENKYGPYSTGTEVKVPEYAAVYLMLKGKAEVR
jgi:DNA primase small subunit